jgi:hypothetical protein
MRDQQHNILRITRDLQNNSVHITRDQQHNTLTIMRGHLYQPHSLNYKRLIHYIFRDTRDNLHLILWIIRHGPTALQSPDYEWPTAFHCLVFKRPNTLSRLQEPTLLHSLDYKRPSALHSLDYQSLIPSKSLNYERPMALHSLDDKRPTPSQSPNYKISTALHLQVMRKL